MSSIYSSKIKLSDKFEEWLIIEISAPVKKHFPLVVYPSNPDSISSNKSKLLVSITVELLGGIQVLQLFSPSNPLSINSGYCSRKKKTFCDRVLKLF